MPPKKKWRPADPRLQTRSWRNIVATWQQRIRDETANGGWIACEAQPCLIPGTPIRIGTPRGPTHLDVGHKIPRALDKRLTWTITDTRPEHSYCSRKAGSSLANQLKKQRQAETERTKPKEQFTIKNDDW